MLAPPSNACLLTNTVLLGVQRFRVQGSVHAGRHLGKSSTRRLLVGDSESECGVVEVVASASEQLVSLSG